MNTKTIVILLISFIIYLRISTIKIELNYINNPQLELKKQGPLLNSDGNLIESGWARNKIKTLNIQNLSYFNRILRYKQWDYYHFVTDNSYFGIALVDLGFIQTIQIHYYNFDKDLYIANDALLIPYFYPKLQLDTITQYKLEGSLEIKIDCQPNYKKFHIKQADFETEFIIVPTKIDSIVTITPINEDGSQFFYNEKTYNWVSQGKLILQNEQYHFHEQNSGMDFGRGVWSYDSPWLWLSVLGESLSKEKIGINLGGGFQHSKAKATEEAFFLNNKMFKLRDLIYRYDLNDYTKTVTVISNGRTIEDFKQREKVKDGDFFIEFRPKLINHNKKDLLLIKLDMHQLIGYGSGAYVQDNKIIAFQNVIGLIEFNKSKW